VQEAEALISDHSNSIFNYGTELLRIASGGRGRLAGGDTLHAATEAAGRMWEKLWRPDAYPGTQTWETRFPLSARRVSDKQMAFANLQVARDRPCFPSDPPAPCLLLGFDLLLVPGRCLPLPDLLGSLEDRFLIQFKDGLLLVGVSVGQE